MMRKRNKQSSSNSGLAKREPKKALPKSSGPSEVSGLSINEITMTAEQFSGPLPSPRVLKEYDDLCPGAAREIILWADKEQRFRRRDITLGRIFSLIYSLAVCGVALYAIHKGHPEAAAIVVGLNVVGVCVGVFAYRNK